MTIRYKLFNRPGNLEEFLDRERKDNQKKVKIEIYENSWYEEMGFSEHRYKMKVEALNDSRRNILISKYEGLSGLCGAGNLKEVQNQILEDKNELIKKIREYGFEADYKKEKSEDGEEVEEPKVETPKAKIPKVETQPVETKFINPWDIKIPKLGYMPKRGRGK